MGRSTVGPLLLSPKQPAQPVVPVQGITNAYLVQHAHPSAGRITRWRALAIGEPAPSRQEPAQTRAQADFSTQVFIPLSSPGYRCVTSKQAVKLTAEPSFCRGQLSFPFTMVFNSRRNPGLFAGFGFNRGREFVL
jgi:hypothetical protein